MKKTILRVLALSMVLMLLLTSSGLALTLRYPQRSTHVSSLQTALARLGYYSSTIDGVYGKGTRLSVRAFQAAYGLSVDGVAGPATLAKLESLTGIQIGDTSAAPDTGTNDTPTTGKGLFSGVYTTLQLGSKGDRVCILQRALLALGFEAGAVDGDFGSGTTAAVKAFQKAVGLTADGKAGKQTLQKLESYFDENGNCTSSPLVTPAPSEPEEDEDTTSPDYDVPTRTLRFGMSGEDVKYTQQRLYTLGYYTGTKDGQFGNGMLKAVKAFQETNGLSADGVIGAGTRKVLFSTSALPAGSVSTPSDEPTQEPTPTPTPTPVQTLQWGDSGDAVKQLQSRLKELGYYTSTLDGIFGSGTYKAVRAFQTRNGLSVDGKAGPTTLAKLYSDSAIGAEDEEAGESAPTPIPTPTPAATPSRTLRYGYTGEDVKLLQNRLIELGYLTATADGNFGSATLAAVKAFQKAHGLSIDGVAGPATYKKLFSDSALEAPESGDTVIIPDRTLAYGATGDDVKSVQRQLKALKYFTGSVDGQYGDETLAAMKAFQQMNGLTATGEGNMATYAKLFSDGVLTAEGVKEGASSPSYTTLRTGATGTAVIRLQQMLAKYNYEVDVTGTYDDATFAAVQSFQALNGLSVDGVAGKNTQTKLYSGSCKSFPTGSFGSIYGSMGYVSEPSKSSIKLLHWVDDIKPTLSNRQAILCYDPATDISWSLTIIALGRHCDVEPTTKADTAAMNAAFGGEVTWTPKPVYVRLPSGQWTVATTHNVPHGINPIKDNDFEGQNCVHFLRDMSEAEKNDPDYGVTNQKALRSFWYSLKGENIPYK